MGFNPGAELDLVDLYYATEGTKYLALVLCVLLACEIFATLPAEVKHVWNSRWSFGRVMFHANRIWAPIMLAIYVPSLFMYHLSHKLYVLIEESSQASIASVLIARIWAIYQLKIWALIALCLGCFILGTPSIVVLQMQASAAHLMKNPAPELISGCPTTIYPLAFVPYLPPFVAETILFILTIYKPLKMSRQVMTPLMSRLILHGTQYYVVVFATLVFIVLGSLFPRMNHVVNGSGLIVAVWSIVCSRLILSGRSWYDKSQIAYSIDRLEMTTLPHSGWRDGEVSWRMDVCQGDSKL
ncbi:unnamed protein product [Rhizoctonia solani]|uniref:DUF6533 domain-containing protein n=1 Tax=Rhizoctonia solani TaxID=456999 RepID=A0A8H3BYT1_9AGAM|nr:unnamed protein product [Rhizoctonia solani]